MEIATTFTILLPADEAYRCLLDLEQVAPCVPGAELGPAAADGAYPANVTVRLGPMRLGYSGSLWISEQDDSARRAVLRAKANETGAQGSLEASMTMNVTPGGEGSRVDVLTELALAGRAARLGRGIVDDVARRLVAEMAACLEQRLGDEGRGQQAQAANTAQISGIKLLLRVVAERLGSESAERRPMNDPDFTFSAGPVTASARTLAALGSPIIYHYDPAFLERFRRTERKVGAIFRTENDIMLMQGEAVLGLEAAARALVTPGMPVLNLVSGRVRQGHGPLAEGTSGRAARDRGAYDDAVDPAEVERVPRRATPRSSSSRSSIARRRPGHSTPSPRSGRSRKRTAR